MPINIPTSPNSLQLLSDVRRGQWFLHEHEALIPTALAFLKGEAIHGDIAKSFNVSLSTSSTFGGVSSQSSQQPQKVAVIPIVGVISKYDSCCDYGATTYAKAITAAAQHEEVCAIVLDIDSGGGATNAVSIIIEAIRGAQALDKPVIAHVDQCASLAYWIASQCDAIFCDNDLSAVGSIGGYYHFLDSKPYLEKQGYKVVTVYADESSDKNVAFRNAIDGDDKLLKENLSYSVKKFHADVKRGRPNLDAEADGVLTGAMFNPAKAKEVGLINGMGTLLECIEIAAIRANNK